MSPLPDDREALDPGEAYQACVKELHQAHPDYERAQVYATLSLEETLREMCAQVADLAKQITLASRR